MFRCGPYKLRQIVDLKFLFHKLRGRHLSLTATVYPCSSLFKFSPNLKCFPHGIKFGKQNLVRNSLFSTSASRLCTSSGSQPKDEQPDAEPEMISVTFVTPEGEVVKVRAKVGENVLNLAKEYDVGAEGACDGKLACTTCHMYVDKCYEQFVEEASEQEEDLLDTAPFLKENSRLTCQITLTKEMDGICFVLPKATVNFYVDGHKPTPH